MQKFYDIVDVLLYIFVWMKSNAFKNHFIIRLRLTYIVVKLCVMHVYKKQLGLVCELPDGTDKKLVNQQNDDRDYNYMILTIPVCQGY